MAKIDNVDYEAMPKNARNMRNYGKELNKEAINAFKNVENMHKSWYGDRYNELIKKFNNLVPQMNEMLNLVVTEIPVALENVANNYSQADKGKNATTVDNTPPQKITNIAIHKDVGMRFITAEVQNTQTKVSNNFKNAKAKMDQIASEYNKVKWTSDASVAFKRKFNSLKTNISKSFDDINSSFTKLMNQAKDDIQRTEKANTVQ